MDPVLKKATGVEYINNRGEKKVAHVNKEVSSNYIGWVYQLGSNFDFHGLLHRRCFFLFIKIYF